MKLLNFGSINIDHVYRIAHFVRPGETINSMNYECFAGGKGCNQSVALARAGAKVMHAGKLGDDGLWLQDMLESQGVDVSLIQRSRGPSGHAIIQVDNAGQNAIILHGGANQSLHEAEVDRILSVLNPGDVLLLQSEINRMPEIFTKASQLKVTIIFNPAPMNDDVLKLPLEHVDHFIINEIEGEQLTGRSEPDAILQTMRKRFPEATVLLTLGSQGVIAEDSQQRVTVPALKVNVVDTTAAGDTFIGFYLAEYLRGSSLEQRIHIAVKASALCVTKRGATDSIPNRNEVLAF